MVSVQPCALASRRADSNCVSLLYLFLLLLFFFLYEYVCVWWVKYARLLFTFFFRVVSFVSEKKSHQTVFFFDAVGPLYVCLD